MNVNVAIGWIIFFVIILIIILCCLNNKSIYNILTAIFWIFIGFVFIYSAYTDYVNNQPNPNVVNRVDVVFENIGSYFEQRLIPIDTCIELPDNKPETISLYKNAYVLGFPLERGVPTHKWVSTQNNELQKLQEIGYYTVLRNFNIKRLTPPAGVSIHDTNTLTMSIYNYNSFDTVESYDGEHLYIYTRDEWDWIIKNNKCPWTRKKVPDSVIKNIKNRNKIATALGAVITYPLNNDNENKSEQKSMSYIDNQIEGVPNNNANPDIIITVPDPSVLNNDINFDNFEQKTVKDTVKNMDINFNDFDEKEIKSFKHIDSIRISMSDYNSSFNDNNIVNT
jgi:hypothetical protein